MKGWLSFGVSRVTCVSYVPRRFDEGRSGPYMHLDLDLLVAFSLELISSLLPYLLVGASSLLPYLLVGASIGIS